MSQITQFSTPITVPVPVPSGGTGDVTLLLHGLLVGNGTSPINTVSVGATGTVLIGNTAADPSFSATPSVTSITIANAPTVGTDGTNKTYVDAIAAGLSFKAACIAGTTANLTSTYANGAAGVGATLTNTGTLAAFSVDGITPSVTSRILVKNQSTTFQNGIYTVTVAGTGAVAWVLTRATDFDSAVEIVPGALVPITTGTVNAGTIWLQTATVVTVGTDPVVFALFSQPGISTITGNTGGALTGTNITFTGGTTGLAFGGAGTTETLSGTLAIGNGGTNATTFTNIYGTVYYDGTRLVDTTTGTTGLALVSAGAALPPAYGIVPIAGGGTNASSMTTADGVVYYDGTRLVTTTAGLVTQVLTSNGPGVAPTFQTSSGGSGITTISTESGFVSAPTVSITAHGAIAEAGASCEFFVDAGTPTVIQLRTTDTNNNTIVGGNTGTYPSPGTSNTGFGKNVFVNTDGTSYNNSSFGYNALSSLTSSNTNCAFGSGCMASLQDGLGNIAMGVDAMSISVSSTNNIAIGGSALYSAEGFGNTVVGTNSMGNVTTGSFNVAIGEGNGNNYDGGESSNILIGLAIDGVEGESNVCRIGNGTGTSDGQLNKTFISGIAGITTAVNDAIPVLISATTGQMGTVSSSRKFKKNIKDMGSDSDVLMSLRPVTFNYKSDSLKSTHYGLIAEEVFDIAPDLTVSDKDGDLLTVKYHELPILLLNELKKLHLELKTQRSEIDMLKLKLGV